jgi:hypothetical protein
MRLISGRGIMWNIGLSSVNVSALTGSLCRRNDLLRRP